MYETRAALAQLKTAKTRVLLVATVVAAQLTFIGSHVNVSVPVAQYLTPVIPLVTLGDGDDAFLSSLSVFSECLTSDLLPQELRDELQKINQRVELSFATLAAAVNSAASGSSGAWKLCLATWSRKVVGIVAGLVLFFALQVKSGGLAVLYGNLSFFVVIVLLDLFWSLTIRLPECRRISVAALDATAAASGIETDLLRIKDIAMTRAPGLPDPTPRLLQLQES